MTAGIYDLFAQIVLLTNEDLAYFITERIAAIEGIRDIQTIMVPKFTKAMEEYSIPLIPNPLYKRADGHLTELDEETFVSD